MLREAGPDDAVEGADVEAEQAAMPLALPSSSPTGTSSFNENEQLCLKRLAGRQRRWRCRTLRCWWTGESVVGNVDRDQRRRSDGESVDCLKSRSPFAPAVNVAASSTVTGPSTFAAGN